MAKIQGRKNSSPCNFQNKIKFPPYSIYKRVITLRKIVTSRENSCIIVIFLIEMTTQKTTVGTNKD